MMLVDDAHAAPRSASALRAWRSPKAWILFLGLFVAGLFADLGTKNWAFETVAGRPVALDREALIANPQRTPIPPHEGRDVLPGGLLHLQLVLNPGAVFGIGAHQRTFFVLFTLAAFIVGLALFGLGTRAGDRLGHAALGLVFAGGVGNLYDRIVYGRVRDFLQVLADRRLPRGWTWPGTNNPELCPWVFNIADLLLLVGMILLLVHLNARGTRKRGAVAPS